MRSRLLRYFLCLVALYVITGGVLGLVAQYQHGKSCQTHCGNQGFDDASCFVFMPFFEPYCQCSHSSLYRVDGTDSWKDW